MQDEKLQTVAEEISLKDVVDFLQCNWRRIAFGVIVGLLFAAVYVMQAPEKYEAVWQVQMAQFVNANSEEPAALSQRLRLPTAYPVEVQRACGMPQDGEFGDYLDGRLEIHPTKNVATAVDMKFRAANPVQTRQCAEAIMTMLIAQQRELIQERIGGHQEQIAQYKQALAEEQRQLERINVSVLSNFGYLARLDKLSALRTRIDALQSEIVESQKRPAKLIAPIYAPSKPIPSKRGAVLWLGMWLGLMFGVLYALGRKIWPRVA